MKSLNDLFMDFRNGDEQAFCEIYRLYFQRLCQYGLIFCVDHTRVENIVQDLFLHLLTHGKKMRHVINLEGYLYKSVKQNILTSNQLHHRRAVIRNLLVDSNGSASSPEEILMQQESRSHLIFWLKGQIEALPTKQKEIIYLKFYEGFSYTKIAQITGLSNQVIRNYVSRAMHKIRQKNKMDEI